MRVSSRAVVTSVVACALAVGWLGASSASARPASDSPGARHIVVLRDDVDPDAAAKDHGRRHGAEVQGIYRHALKGYVAVLKGNAAADLARDPRVAFVELDGAVSVHGGSQTIGSGGPWGLDRIDDATGLDGSFTYNAEGAGVTAYIIDTGIQYNHVEFGGRAVKGADFAPGKGTGADCDGHGTHVAGTVGGATYGVAKNVKLVSVRVLDCKGSGTYSAIIAGIDWVTKNHVPGTRAVANMSLGGSAALSIDTAVENSIKAGITYVVAAGNGNKAGVGQDACKYSPAKVPTAITIGATDSSDIKSGWSNYGPCVDFFAPGVNVVSAGYSKTSTTAAATMSGTSMAAPHVAGVVALHLSSQESTPTPAEVQSDLNFSTNVVKSALTSPFPYVIFTNGL